MTEDQRPEVERLRAQVERLTAAFETEKSATRNQRTRVADLRAQVERLTAELAKKGHSRDEVQHWADKWEAERKAKDEALATVARLTDENEKMRAQADALLARAEDERADREWTVLQRLALGRMDSLVEATKSFCDTAAAGTTLPVRFLRSFRELKAAYGGVPQLDVVFMEGRTPMSALTFREMGRLGVRVTDEQLGAMPCECALQPGQPSCGDGWIRCGARCKAWVDACKVQASARRRELGELPL